MYIEQLHPSEKLFAPTPYEYEPEKNTSGIAESARYFQKEVRKLDLLADEKVARLAYQVQLGMWCGLHIDIAREEEGREDEVARMEQFINEGIAAKWELVTGNLRLVAHVARLTMGWVPFGSDGYREVGFADDESEEVAPRIESVFRGTIYADLSILSGAPMPLEDRIQAGTLGLFAAVKNYDPTKDVKFATYAFKCIEGNILTAISDDRRIHIPHPRQEDARKVTRAADKLLGLLGREATSDEISIETGLSFADVMKVIEVRKAWDVDSLSNIDQEVLGQIVDPPGDRAIDYDALYLEQVMYEQEADDLLGLFDEDNETQSRYKDVLAMRYGLVTGSPMTYEEIAVQIAVTRGRARQLEQQAKEYLAGNLYRLHHGAREVGERRKRIERLEMLRQISERERLSRIAADKIGAAHGAAGGGD